MNDNMRCLWVEMEVCLGRILSNYVSNSRVLPAQYRNHTYVLDPVLIVESYGEISQGSESRYCKLFFVFEGTLSDKLGCMG